MASKLTALSAAALGTMLGKFVNTRGQADELSIIIGMATHLSLDGLQPFCDSCANPAYLTRPTA